jgi:sulfur carrier protein ThiS adenylyltransferase
MSYLEIESHLRKFRVGIAGAGGLGSNCAAALARCGIGTLVIADFDFVEPMNLNRQYYFTDQVGMFKTDALKENIRRINHAVNVITQTVKLDEKNIAHIFTGCDVIVEALDDSEMKQMLVETILSQMPGIPVIVGSGLAGYGNNETLGSRKIDDTLYVCGDESTTAGDGLPAMAPRVGIVANMQANTVIDLLMRKNKNSVKYENTIE